MDPPAFSLYADAPSSDPATVTFNVPSAAARSAPSPAAAAASVNDSGTGRDVPASNMPASSRASRSSSIVLPWEYDCALPSLDCSSKRSLGAHPYAAFADADDNLFTGMFASVTKALRTALVPPDTDNTLSLRDFLIRWRHTSTSADARVAEVVDAHVMLTQDDVTPLSAAVHSFMAYSSSSKFLSDTERRLCRALKDEVYSHYSVLSLSHVPSPVFPPDSHGNAPCIRLIGIEFSSLPTKRLEPPRFLLIYSRSYHHILDSPENFTFIDVYDTGAATLHCLLRTCCISGHLVSASIDFNLKLIACIAASESLSAGSDFAPSLSGSNSVAAESSAAYWSHQSSAVSTANPTNNSSEALNTVLSSVDDGAFPESSAAGARTASTTAGPQRESKATCSSLRVNVDGLSATMPVLDDLILSRNDSALSTGILGFRQQFDYRTFIWTFKNAGVAASAPHAASSHSLSSDVDDLQLEWYDDESLFSKTCNIIPLTNAAPILLRLRQEEFVLVSGREKLRRLATEKEMRECPRLCLPSLMLDQIFVDKPPPNRVLPYSGDAAPDGVLASRVLFYQWFPSDFQLLVVSVLKSAKAHDVYDKAMKDNQNPKFVAIQAIVRLFRLDTSLKKGRPALIELLADKISIKWPNLAMQERSRRDLAQHVSISTAGMKKRSFSSDSASTPLTPGPPTPSSFASSAATVSYVSPPPVAFVVTALTLF
jgi:hypothetical protein